MQVPEEMEFLCLYIMCFLLVNDLEGARHLWRRAPSQFKGEATQLAAVWKIGQCLWQQNMAEAYEAMTPQFSPAVAALVRALKQQLLAAQLRLVAQGYSAIRAGDLASRLDASAEETLAKCQALGWEVDAEGFVMPKALHGGNGSGAGGDVLDSTDTLARLTSYVAHFEQKPVKVDIKVGKDSGGAAATSSSSSSSSVV